MLWNKVWTFSKGLEVSQLQLTKKEVLTPKSDELLIKVFSYGVNSFDIFWLKSNVYFPYGFEFCGEVIEVGNPHSRFQIGDILMGISNSQKQDRNCAEWCIANENHCIHLPNHLTFQQGAALPFSGIAALQLIEQLDFSHKKVLIIGATGGIGHLFTQLCTTKTQQITVVCKPAHRDFLSKIGIQHFLENQHNQWSTNDEFEYILDFSGKYSTIELSRNLAKNGMIITTQQKSKAVLDQFFAFFKKQNVQHFQLDYSATHFEKLAEMLHHRQIHPFVFHSFNQFEQLPTAYNELSKGGVQGKLVVSLGC